MFNRKHEHVAFTGAQVFFLRQSKT